MNLESNGLLVLSFYNSSPTHKGSINQEPSSARGSFGALPLRPTAMIRRTFHEVLLYASVYDASDRSHIPPRRVEEAGSELSIREKTDLYVSIFMV